MVGPPDLVVGRGGDGAQLGAWNGSANGGVEVRGAAFLGFNSAEVLHLPPDTTAGVLPEPIHQRREVNRIPSSPPVVIPIRVHRSPVGVNPAGHQRWEVVSSGRHLLGGTHVAQRGEQDGGGGIRCESGADAAPGERHRAIDPDAGAARQLPRYGQV